MKENTSLKVAMIGHKRIPSREGGIEIVVEELSIRMAKKGIEVTCYNRKGKHALDKSQKVNHIKIKKLVSKLKKRLFTVIITWASVYKKLLLSEKQRMIEISQHN